MISIHPSIDPSDTRACVLACVRGALDIHQIKGVPFRCTNRPRYLRGGGKVGGVSSTVSRGRPTYR